MKFFINETNMVDYDCFIRPHSEEPGHWEVEFDISSIYYQNKSNKLPVFSGGTGGVVGVESLPRLSAGVISEPGKHFVPMYNAIVGMFGKYYAIYDIGPVDILVIHKQTQKQLGYIFKYVIINEDGGGMDIQSIKKEHKLSFFAAYADYYTGHKNDI